MKVPVPRLRRVYRVARAAALAFALLSLALPLFAQSSALVDRLPADTWAYLSWVGTASLKPVNATNAILRLYSDPSFSAFLDRSIFTVSHEGGPAGKFGGLTPEQGARILSALENPAVLGLVSSPRSSPAGQGSSDYFVIYDGTGKRELIETLRRERDARVTPPPRWSTVLIAGVSVEKRVWGSQTSYEAKSGNYYLYAGSAYAMEELLRAPAAGPASRAPSPSFPQACREMAQTAALAVLVRPAPLHAPEGSGDAAFDWHAASRSLGLDRIGGACLSVTFEKEITRTRGAVLGDTSPGSLLNVLGDNRDSFQTMSLAGRASSFQVSNLDFAGLYNSLFKAASAALPASKAPFLAAGVAFLASTWGMPPDQAFALFTGEAAEIHPDVGTDPSARLYAFTIHDPDKVLHILEHALPGERTSTNREREVTYLEVTLPARSVSPSLGAAPTATYFALTPNMLLVSKKEGLVRDGVAHLESADGAAASRGLAGDGTFQKARESLPAKLASLTYQNYANFNWQKAIADFENRRSDRAGLPSRQEGLAGLDPALLARYLHVFIGGAWKDSNGISFDSYIQ